VVVTPHGLEAHRRGSLAFEGAYRALVMDLSIDENQARAVLRELASSARRALDSLQEKMARRAG
jgi:hypothetical protein